MISGISIALFGLAGLCAVVYLAPWLKRGGMVRTVIKTLPLALFAMAAWMENAPWLLVAGFTLSALGDAFLAHEGDRMFMAGLGSFLTAHLLFAVLFYTLADDLAGAWPIVTGICVFALGFGTALVRQAGPLAFPVAVYVLAIAGMGITASATGGWVLAGAISFMISDALLGIEKFLLQKESHWQVLTSPGVWVLYIGGQAMILAGVLMVMAN